MGDKIFDNPKDHEEIAKLVDYATESDSTAIVVDFFAGSGTAGHAVWALNAKDNGARRFLLVQLPEPLTHDAKAQRAAAALSVARAVRTRRLGSAAQDRLACYRSAHDAAPSRPAGY